MNDQTIAAPAKKPRGTSKTPADAGMGYNVEERALLAAFQNMTDADRSMIADFAEACAVERPRDEVDIWPTAGAT